MLPHEMTSSFYKLLRRSWLLTSLARPQASITSSSTGLTNSLTHLAAALAHR